MAAKSNKGSRAGLGLRRGAKLLAAAAQPPLSLAKPRAPRSPPAARSSGSVVAPRKALPMRSFSESLPMALLRAREAVMQYFRPNLRTHRVTEQQWRVLRALAGHTALEITELADITCLLAPSISRILPDLEARGFIRRRPVESDLRRSVVSLEPEGLKLIAAHAPSSEDAYNTIEQRFGTGRMQQLFTLLRELETALAQGEEPAPPRARKRKNGGEAEQA